MKLTITSIIGHLTVSNTVTALEPRPRTLPAWAASPPVNRTATALAVIDTTVTSVTPILRQMSDALASPR